LPRAFLSAQGPSLSIPTHRDAFQLHLTPFNSTPQRSAKEKALVGALAAFAATAALRVPDAKVNLLAGFLASSGANELSRRRRERLRRVRIHTGPRTTASAR
jgi:hypothetical protein